MSYPFYCPECGRSGTEDDGCELGGQCPDEDCDGTIVANLPRFYFTFGQAYSLRDNYVVVSADSRDEARRVMQSIYGRIYAFDYDEAAFLPQIDQYGLTEVPFGTPSIQEHPL